MATTVAPANQPERFDPSIMIASSNSLYNTNDLIKADDQDGCTVGA
jgi:hypothetical protein